MDEAAEIRTFNRFYTHAIGVLDGGLHDTPWSLTEARVLLELSRQPATDVADLRRRLSLDAGHLSRLLARLQGNGLIERVRSHEDRRRQIARLTEAGHETYALLDARAASAADAMVAHLTTEQRRDLVGALRMVRTLLGDPSLEPAPEPISDPGPERADAGPTTTRGGAVARGGRAGVTLIRDAEAGDLGWVVEAHGRLYAREYGWGAGFEALVARVCADFLELGDPARARAWIAEVDGRRAGCILCVPKDAQTAQLRLLLVEPFARGLGLGGRLVDTCVRFAERAGYRDMVLWTNHPLVDARRIYERAGFALEATEPHADWGVQLEGQIWRRPLGAAAAARG